MEASCEPLPSPSTALFYPQQLSQRVQRLCPGTSEALLIASRAQPICRWQIPRGDHPMDRTGCLKWRADLKEFHAQKSVEILSGIGYDQAMVERVQALNLKRDLGRDPEAKVGKYEVQQLPG